MTAPVHAATSTSHSHVGTSAAVPHAAEPATAQASPGKGATTADSSVASELFSAFTGADASGSTRPASSPMKKEEKHEHHKPGLPARHAAAKVREMDSVHTQVPVKHKQKGARHSSASALPRVVPKHAQTSHDLAPHAQPAHPPPRRESVAQALGLSFSVRPENADVYKHISMRPI